MYKEGDLIIYGGDGVCKVVSIGPAPFSSLDQTKLYYTLAPLYRSGTVYAPTDVSVTMRPILTEEEALALIRRIPSMEPEQLSFSGSREAQQGYKAMLQTYDIENLVKLIRIIYTKNAQAIASKRSYSHVEERFLKRAQELLHGELAAALHIPVGEVAAFITNTVKDE